MFWYLCSDLVPALPGLQVHDLTHVCGVESLSEGGKLATGSGGSAVRFLALRVQSTVWAEWLRCEASVSLALPSVRGCAVRPGAAA